LRREWRDRPKLDDLLSDDLIQAVMRSDGIDPSVIKALFSDLARKRGDEGREWFQCRKA